MPSHAAPINTNEENPKNNLKKCQNPPYGPSLDSPILTNLHNFRENTTFESADLSNAFLVLKILRPCLL